MHILAALQNDRTESSHQKLEGGEHTGRAGSYNDDRLSRRHIGIFIQTVLLHIFTSLVGIYLISVQYVIAGIHGPSYNLAFRNSLRSDSKCLGGGSHHLFIRKFLAYRLCYFN